MIKKKIISIVFLILGSLVLVSCGTNTFNKKYTIRWESYEGSLLQKDEEVALDTMPNYEGKTPTRLEDFYYTYVFTGWSPEVKKVTGNQTYIAVFEAKAKVLATYTITWKNEDGSDLSIDEKVTEGLVPSYKGKTPTKASDSDQYIYVFSGWSPEVKKVTGDQTYTAVFKQAEKSSPSDTFVFKRYYDDTYEIVDYNKDSTLTDVIIPSTYNDIPVTSIGSKAFSKATHVRSITIPQSIEYISHEAFDNLEELIIYAKADAKPSQWYTLMLDKEVTILYGYLNHIKDDNFEYAVTKSGLYITKELQIENNSNIVIPSDIQGYNVVGMYKNIFKDNHSIENIVIPNTINRIEYGTFKGLNNIKSITIPFVGRSRNEIGNEATLANMFGFNYYESRDSYFPSTLTEVIITDATHIGKKAFSKANNLTNVVIPNTVLTIGEEAFSKLESLTNIVIPNSVTNIGYNAFSNTKNLEMVTFEEGSKLERIEDYAFSGTEKLTDIVIPNTVKSIGAYAFYQAGNLKSLEFETGSRLIEIKASAFSPASNLTSITIPNSVTSIGNYAFNKADKLTELVLSNSLIKIGDSAFSGVKNLTTLFIPNTVKSIGDAAFYELKNLETLTFEEQSSLIQIGDRAFYGAKKLTSLTIPDSVTNIGNSAFSGATNLRTVILPSNLTKISDSLLYEATRITSVTIPNSVTSIGSSAFSGATNLTHITIPNSVTSIGSSAFYNASSLKTVTFEKGTKITSIPDKLFYDATSLESIIIPNSITSIGEGAFDNASSLKTVTFEEGIKITSIPKNLFYAASALESIVIPDGVTSIGDNAFYRATSLKNITLPNSVTSIGRKAFYQTRNLISITLPSNLTNIDENAFESAIKLESVVISSQIKLIEKDAFKDTSSRLIIYTDAEFKKEGWHEEWVPRDKKVYWKDQWQYGSDGNPKAN